MRPLFLALALSSVASAQSPMLVSTDWLASRLNDPRVVVLHVGHDAGDFAQGHIQGARQVPYRETFVERDGIGTELPPVAHAEQLFEKLGVSDDSHVVIYVSGRNMAPMASRVFLTLDYLGHDRVSLLDGGLVKWRAENRPLATAPTPFAAGTLTPKPRTVTVGAEWMVGRLGKPGVSFIDTRTTPEYLGTGSRSGLPSTGHLEGARQLEWQQLFSDADAGTFLPVDQIRKLYADRVTPGDTVVTYCLVGYRASMTYFAARMLGLPVRLYDGSYQEWARKNLPLKAGTEP